MDLSRHERETIINFNEAEATAAISTHNGKMRRRLEQLEQKRPNEVSRDHRGDFIIPKAWVKINPGMDLTPEQRAAKAEHARKSILRQKTTTRSGVSAVQNSSEGTDTPKVVNG